MFLGVRAPTGRVDPSVTKQKRNKKKKKKKYLIARAASLNVVVYSTFLESGKHLVIFSNPPELPTAHTIYDIRCTIYDIRYTILYIPIGMGYTRKLVWTIHIESYPPCGHAGRQADRQAGRRNLQLRSSTFSHRRHMAFTPYADREITSFKKQPGNTKKEACSGRGGRGGAAQGKRQAPGDGQPRASNRSLHTKLSCLASVKENY